MSRTASFRQGGESEEIDFRTAGALGAEDAEMQHTDFDGEPGEAHLDGECGCGDAGE